MTAPIDTDDVRSRFDLRDEALNGEQEVMLSLCDEIDRLRALVDEDAPTTMQDLDDAMADVAGIHEFTRGTKP